MSKMKQILQRVLKQLGFQISRFPGYLDQDRIRQLILKNFDIGYVIDGGANEGQYGCQLRAFGYRETIVSFEPVPSIFSRLQKQSAADPLWHCRCLGLGDQDVTAEINVAGKMSSILSRDASNDSMDFVCTGKEDIKITRLDAVFDPIVDGRERRVLLKLDLQGFELSALKGGGEVLERIVVIEVEMALWPIYKNGADYREVSDYLLGQGFVLWAIFPHGPHAVTGRMSEVDAFFVNERYI